MDAEDLGEIALVAPGAVLAFMLVEDWQFAVGAISSIFLTIWVLFRIRLVDAIWAFLTYAVFHLLWLMSFSRQLLLDYY